MKVYAVITRVVGALAKEGIGKGRKNEQQGFLFRGIDDLYNALAGIVAREGLCILPRVLARTVVERPTKSGGVSTFALVDVEFDLVAAEDGSKHTIRTMGEAMDTADKATNKAMSAAMKYACLMAFQIPTEGDNDADAHTPEPVRREPAPQTETSKQVNGEILRSVLADIRAASTIEDLRAIAARVGKSPPPDVLAAYNDRKAALAGAA